MGILGILATVVFACAWAFFTFMVITDPPEIDPPDMVLLYVILTCGVLVIFRSFALGF